MVLSEIGKIVEQEWLKTEQLRDNVRFNGWIIMPNHIHGIVIIERPYCRDARRASPVEQRNHSNGDACQASLQGEQKIIIQNLSNIIRGFKSSVTSRVQKLGFFEFAWQSRFFEHIIRTEKSLQKIREYIVNNPAKWELDKYYIDT